MEFLRVKVAYWKQFVSRYRLLSLAFFFTFFALMLPFPPTLSSFMPARQGIFVRDTVGSVLGNCCKVMHSVTKPYKQFQN